MGAVLAFELAHQLTTAAGVELVRLIVSGSPGPWGGRTERAGDLPEEQFLAKVATFAGYQHPVLEHPEMRELLLPTLRADVILHESYSPAPGRQLSVPVTALHGRNDDLVGAGQLAEWQEATTGPLTTALQGLSATANGGSTCLTRRRSRAGENRPNRTYGA
jgi:surfactin synthase thioesterase subunit